MTKKPSHEDLVQQVLELQKTEEAFRESEEKFRLLFEHSADAHVLYKGDRFIDCNQASMEMLGYDSKAQLLDMHPADISPKYQPDGQLSAEKAELMIALAFAKGHHRFEWVCLRSDGSDLLLNVLLNAIRAGGETLIHGVWRDITKQKQVEAALRESEQRYKSAQRLGLVGNWEYHLVTESFWGSDQAKRIYGFNPEDETFTTDQVEKCIPERERVHQALVDLIEKGTPYDLEFEIRPVSGPDRKVIRSIAELVRDDSGTPVKVIGVIQDITQSKQIENELILIAKRLKEAQRIAQVGDWEWDPVTDTVTWSEQLYRIFSLDPSTPPPNYQGQLKLYHSVDSIRLDEAVTAALRDGTPYELELRRTNPDGQEIFLLARGEAETDQSGAVTRLFGSVQNITSHKINEKWLRESEERFRRAIASSPMPIMIHDQDDNVLQLSDGWTRLSGYSIEDIPTLPDWTEKAYGERTGIQKAYIDDLFNIDRSVNNGEWTIQTKSGTSRIWEFQTTPLGESSTGRRILLSMAADVTERKQIEEALRKGEERFRELFENAPFPYQSLDDGGCFLEVNRRWLEHLGYSRDEVIGKSFAEFLHPEWQDHFRENFPRFKSIGEILGVEFQLRKKDGSHIWVSFDGKIRRDPAGQFVQTHCVFNDISEQKRLQDKVNQQREALNQSRKLESIGRLAGGVAHDFNNMLSIILGYTALAMEKIDKSDSLYDDLQEIYQAGMRSADITRQLLAFARQQTIAPKVLNLNDNIGSMTKMLRHLIGEDIDFAWMPGPQLWSVKIDPSQIDQILANLCVNARDAIADVGKVTIETKNVEFDEEYCADHAEFIAGAYVMLAVSDDGCGIAPEVMGQIFEPFFTTKGLGQGTGLGLATVYGIVKQNKGFINVYSEPEKGTVIKVYLPRYAEQTATERNEPGRGLPSGQGETILLVEDDATILKLGKRMLENLGYKVLSTTRSNDAKKIAEEYDGRIDLLLTDVVMPEMNGRELSEQLQTIYPKLKTLFMSGYTANVIAHRGVLDEGINFVSKPFSLKEIATKVREVLK